MRKLQSQAGPDGQSPLSGHVRYADSGSGRLGHDDRCRPGCGLGSLQPRENRTRGQLYAHLEGRWDYGTTGPQNLGFVNLGSQIGTGNAFSGYYPSFLPLPECLLGAGKPGGRLGLPGRQGDTGRHSRDLASHHAGHHLPAECRHRPVFERLSGLRDWDSSELSTPSDDFKILGVFLRPPTPTASTGARSAPVISIQGPRVRLQDHAQDRAGRATLSSPSGTTTAPRTGHPSTPVPARKAGG